MPREVDTWRESFPDLIIAQPQGCSCGRTSLVIGSNGDLRLCPFDSNTIGNIYLKPLLRNWESVQLSTPADAALGICGNRFSLPDTH
ncbi:MAG: hypothetical protein HQL01_06900 [Nitrospirae bacterium]|nr:hypothetical protein [Nitrospirota bacterium]